MRLIEKVWFKGHAAKWLLVPILAPFSLLFSLISGIRRLLYRCGIFATPSIEVPVVVVGNIGIGGNGKTPLTLFLVEQCKLHGIKVGVLSRGYGSKAPHYPYLVDENSSAESAGDEPLLIFQRTKIPVVIGSDRIKGAALLQSKGCQLIIADDGLQHYRLPRDIELIVVDGNRGFGNGLLLPAGPLREGVWRIANVPYVIVNGGTQQPEIKQALTQARETLNMNLLANEVCHIQTGKRVNVEEFIRRYPIVNAIAGIGDPSRFFKSLSRLGFALDRQEGFIDHHKFNLEDFEFDNGSIPLLMTEKDQVKCLPFAKENWWYLPVDANFDNTNISALVNDIIALVRNK